MSATSRPIARYQLPRTRAFDWIWCALLAAAFAFAAVVSFKGYASAETEKQASDMMAFAVVWTVLFAGASASTVLFYREWCERYLVTLPELIAEALDAIEAGALPALGLFFLSATIAASLSSIATGLIAFATLDFFHWKAAAACWLAALLLGACWAICRHHSLAAEQEGA